MSDLRLKSKIAAGTGIAALAVAAPIGALAATNWQVPLKGSATYPTATGSAQYQSQQGHREVQVEVQHVRSLASRKVVFSVGGVTLGSAKVSARGQADVTRNTEIGQRVPTVVHGSKVSVRTAGGALIVSGRF